MGVLARVVLAILAGATVAAFFVAEPLAIGEEPPVATASRISLGGEAFSPNGDGRFDSASASIAVRRSGDIAVDVVARDGGRVRRIAELGARAGRLVGLEWDGRTDAGARAPDGRYRLRVTHRGAGLATTVPGAITLDTAAPRPVVARVRRADGGPVAPRGPLIVQPGERVAFDVRGNERPDATRYEVWRTDGGRPRPVRRFGRVPGGPAWDGKVDGGAAAPPGTYLIVAVTEDEAGNRGSAPAALPPQPGEVPGRPGVIVREVAVQPPLEPVRAGERAQFFVDSRGRGYRWSVRRVGASRPVKKGTGKADAPLGFSAPRGISGAYLLEVRSGAGSTTVPFLVQSAEREKILVVLPAIAWLGSDSIDDDGDGLPNALSLGTAVRHPRPLAGEDAGGLPAGFASESAPLLAFLDRARVRYDVTTDLALLRSGNDPSPTDREGVLLAGSSRWVPRAFARRLRRYVERGGRVAAFGADALRRGVTVTRGRFERPTEPAELDAFGARIRAIRRLDVPAELVPLEDDPGLGLLEGVGDVAGTFSVVEESVPPAEGGDGPKLLAGVGQDLGEAAPLDPETGAPQAPLPALSGSRLGRGIVIRVGLPEWGRRLSEDAAVQQITRNAADILRRVRPRPRSPLR